MLSSSSTPTALPLPGLAKNTSSAAHSLRLIIKEGHVTTWPRRLCLQCHKVQVHSLTWLLLCVLHSTTLLRVHTALKPEQWRGGRSAAVARRHHRGRGYVTRPLWQRYQMIFCLGSSIMEGSMPCHNTRANFHQYTLSCYLAICLLLCVTLKAT